MASFTAMM